MRLSPTARAALKQIAASKTPVQRFTKENPGGPHHKSIECLQGRKLVKPKGAGVVATEAGREVLRDLGLA